MPAAVCPGLWDRLGGRLPREGGGSPVRMRQLAARSRWNGSTAVASAVYYDRIGACCTKADQHYYKITMTLSDVWRRGGPHPGPYFDRMTLTGGVHAKLMYNQKFKVWNAVYYKK